LASLLALALLAICAPAVSVGAAIPQVRLEHAVFKLAAGTVSFCFTKDTMIVAATNSSADVDSRPAGIVSLGAGRVAVVLGAADWTDNGRSIQIDAELPKIARQVANSMANIKASDQSATDIESIGVTLLEFVRPLVTDIHYKLDLAVDEPLIEVLLAGYTEGYGPEIWDLQYHVQQQNLGPGYWETRPMRPAYVQLYPPEKGQPQTFIEVRYPAKLAPLELAQAAESNPQVRRIRSSSSDMDDAVAAVVKGESAKAATRPVEDFLRLALPVLVGPQASLVMATLDEQYRFQWLLAPQGAPQEPAETKTSEPPGQQVQTDRPSLRRAGPPER
jgi:hypothetical protein